MSAGSAATGRAFGARDKPVRVGMVGVGNRGSKVLRTLLAVPGTEVPAICDINEKNLERGLDLVEQARGKRPEGYSRGVEDYKRMADRADLDAIITATPWDLHTRVAVTAMKAGKYAATEVPSAITIEECWDLVDTSEKTGMPCMLLENVCFFRNVLMILNMVKQGVFGELLHCEGGYQHDVRAGGNFLKNGDLRWRGMYATDHNANLYPTHPNSTSRRLGNRTTGARWSPTMRSTSIRSGRHWEIRLKTSDIRAGITSSCNNS